MTLGEYDSALKMRNIIRRLATQVVRVERPADKVGRVIEIDRGGGVAKVVYAGDEANPVRVIAYPGLQPLKADRVHGEGMGSIVRIAGPVGSRYIVEILSDGPYVAGPKLVNPRIASGGDTESSFIADYVLRVDAPAASSAIEVATLQVPSRAAHIRIGCELVGDADSYIQTGAIATDWTSAQGTVLTGTTESSSSSGMNLTFTYTTTADMLTVSLTRGTGTRVFTSANVSMRCTGTDISLVTGPESGA